MLNTTQDTTVSARAAKMPNRRAKPIALRLIDSDRELVIAAAKERGCSMAALCESIVLDAIRPPVVRRRGRPARQERKAA